MAGELALEASEDYSYDDCEEFDETNQWMMRDGTVIEIDNMNLSHIQNVVAMLKKKNMYVPQKMKMRLRKEKDTK